MQLHVLLLIIWTSICLAIELFIVIIFIHKLITSKSQNATLSIVIVAANIVCIVCYLCCTAMDLAHFSYSFHFEYTILEYEHADLIIILQCADVFYFTASLSIYILFLYRLYITFRDTDLKLSIIALTLFSLLFLFAVFNMIMYIYYIGKAFSIERNYIISLLCVELTLSLSLSMLFVYKLRQLTIRRQSITWSELSADRLRKMQLDATAKKMLNVITRYAILSIMAIVFGAFFYSVELYQILFMEIPTNTSFSIMYGARQLEVLVCMIAVYLSAASTISNYIQMCNRCHKICFQCFVSSTKQTIIKQSTYYRLQDHENEL